MFQKAVELNPNDQLTMGNLADAYRWSGQRDNANATYQKAIALAYKELEVNPKDTETLSSLAMYYGKTGNTAQSLEFIRRARAINAADVDLIYVEAIVYTLANRPQDAIKSLRTAFGKGYSVEEAKVDPELNSIQGRPEFASLVAEYGKKK
jgi:tetratricopeptide (TPR) repeat protein